MALTEMDFLKINITKQTFSKDVGGWMVWVPPLSPTDFEGGDPGYGAILAPAGETFWDSFDEAVGFVELVMKERS